MDRNEKFLTKFIRGESSTHVCIFKKLQMVSLSWIAAKWESAEHQVLRLLQFNNSSCVVHAICDYHSVLIKDYANIDCLALSYIIYLDRQMGLKLKR